MIKSQMLNCSCSESLCANVSREVSCCWCYTGIMWVSSVTKLYLFFLVADIIMERLLTGHKFLTPQNIEMSFLYKTAFLLHHKTQFCITQFTGLLVLMGLRFITVLTENRRYSKE